MLQTSQPAPNEIIMNYDYNRVNILFGKYFAFHDLEFERQNGVSEDMLDKMKKQNSITGRAYADDCKKRGVNPAKN